MRKLIGSFLLAAAAACAPALSQETGAGADTCGAAHYQYLIGKPKSELPAKPPGAIWRVACDTCVITMDWFAARMDVFYSEKTGLITKVRCG